MTFRFPFPRCTFFVAALSLIFFTAGVFPAFAAVQAKAVVLMEMASGRILYQQNPDAKIAPASLTKVLTLYTARSLMRDRNIPLETRVKVSRAAAAAGGSSMGVKSGEKVSIDRLLYGIAVASGNDASQVLAEHLSGSHQAFVKEMNKFAKRLGMGQSVFKNAHGLPAAGQMITARDMAALSRAYLRDFPEMLHYHSTRAVRHNGVASVNKNPFIGSVDGVDGLKSGWIKASGYNLVSTAQRNGHRLILVVLGAATPELRAQDSIRLLEAGFASIEAAGTVAFQLAQVKPGQYAVSLPRARQQALQDLSRPAKVRGSIGSSKPAPVTNPARAAAPPRKTAPAPAQASLAVGSIGSPAPASTQASGKRGSSLTVAAAR